MAVTAQEVFNITCALIDEMLDTGLLNESDVISYRAKTPSILTVLQAELIKPGDIFSTFEISNKPVENVLGYKSNFDIQAFEGTELTFECNHPAKSYYFEIDDTATVYIEDYTNDWNTLETVSATSTNGFTAYKGVVTPTSGATKSRLRFGGSYYYRCVNRALFNVPFASDEKVPVYRPWVRKQMPSDFKSMDEIINEHPVRQYSKDSGFKWEGKRDLYIDYYYDGNIRVVYRPVPSAITLITDTMQVDDVTARTVVPYGLAAHLLLTENADSASFFQERYEELKAVESKEQPSSHEQITNVYGGFG